MIDVVIPFRSSPRTNDQELKYCLRSIEKHLLDCGQVWLIGEHPNYTDASAMHYIAVEETNWYEYLTRNIHYKLLTACNTPGISDPFLYMNDDHFLLQDMDGYRIPNYHNGKGFTGTGKYHITISNTLHKFPNAVNYDIHAPIVIHKRGYIERVGSLNWKIPFGYAIKTAYSYDIYGGKYMTDYKLDRKPTDRDFQQIMGRPFFSVGDKAMVPPMIDFLKTLYPNKSKYEV